MYRAASPRFALLALAATLPPALVGCDSPTPPTDAAPDVWYPPGERGDVLRVPETDALVIPALQGEVHVVTTELGVPHVYAASEHDLRVAQGFVMARDRYFEMEIIRRYGQGTISELFGEGGLALDVANRTRGVVEVAARLRAGLSPEARAMVDDFAAGWNAYIDAVDAGDAAAPSELLLVRPVLAPRARSVAELMERVDGDDIVGLLAGIVYFLGFGDEDVVYSSIEARVPGVFAGDTFEAQRIEGVIDDILGRADPVLPVLSVESGFGLETASSGSMMLAPLAPRARSMGAHVATSALERLRHAADGWLRLHGGRGADFGSNAWAVGSAGTDDRGGLLAGDGHLPLVVPTLLYQMHLDARVFGEDDAARGELGLYLPGVPAMPLGTNGRIAWSFTYQVADATDWYREEVRLDAEGRPEATRFGGAWRPLVMTEEQYVVRDVPVLGSVGRTESLSRWATADGRPLMSIEGRDAPAGTEPGPGESIVVIAGERVIPDDVDGDGLVTAITFDSVVLDIGRLPDLLLSMGAAESADDFRLAMRRNVGFTNNFTVADDQGHVAYTGYNGTPCRGYLRPDEPSSATWADQADPQRIVDGTRYPGFTVPQLEDGTPDESLGASDPTRCVVPFERWPQSLDPARGFVLTANNDLGGTSLDGDLGNDEHYLGGRWAPGYRGDTIHQGLSALVASRSADVAAMQAIQGEHRSRIAEGYYPRLLAAVERARALAATDGPLDPDEQRLVDLLSAERADLDAAMARLATWMERGHVARSGVVTFYDEGAASDADDAVATMIFNEWYRRLMARIFDDEGIDFVWPVDPRTLRSGIMHRIFVGRGPGNPMMLRSWRSDTEESIFFDVRGTAEIERSDEALVGAMLDALRALRAEPSAPGVGGFGTADMDAWRWGLRHQVRFESIIGSFAGDSIMGVELLTDTFAIDTRRLPLAESIPEGDPREDLRWFPRPGDLFSVDAANPAFDVDADYTYGSGPVMRLVIALDDGRVEGQCILPGGESGRTASEHFDDQARLWLGNRTVPIRYHVADVVAGAVGREVLRPN